MREEKKERRLVGMVEQAVSAGYSKMKEQQSNE